MNIIVSFLVEMTVTLLAVSLIAAYLRPFLRKILKDLCGTEERAQFWTAFTNILLIGMPTILALNYRPDTRNAAELFFDIAGKLSGNLGGLLFMLVCVGAVVSFFALVAPRPKLETK